jgi:hypothetical protein
MTNNDIAFYAFFNKLNGKVYTDPQQMRDDYNDALDECNLEVTPKKVQKVAKKKVTFGKKEKKDKKKKK